MEVVMWDSGWTHHAMYGDGSWFGFMGMHGIFMLILAVLAVVLVISLFRQGTKIVGHDPALTVLGEKYAKGDLSRDEYLQKKKDLKV
jgi:putative membrane protein